MYSLRLSSEILLLENTTCQYNVILFPNTESTVFVATILVIIFVGCCFGFKISGRIYHNLYFVCALFYILVFSSVFIIVVDDFLNFLICSIISIKALFILLLIFFFIDYFVRLLDLWTDSWNYFCSTYYDLFKNRLYSSCNRRWWISRPLIFEYCFELLILSSARLWYLFKFCHRITFSYLAQKLTSNYFLYNFFIN